MFISLKIKNYRSIGLEQTFDLIANSSKLKTNNTFSPIEEKKNLILLKSAVIFGSNASGKSNLIRSMWAIIGFILNSIDLKAGDPIPEKYYDPFLLDSKLQNEPTEFQIDFIAFNGKRHQYKVIFNKEGVIYEYLGRYDTIRLKKIFERIDRNEFVEYGSGMTVREDKRVPRNHLFLTKCGNTTNNQIRDIYLYFKGIKVCNVAAKHHTENLYKQVQSIFNNPEHELFRQRLSKLINIADTKIDEVFVKERRDKDFSSVQEKFGKDFVEKYKYETFGNHKVFNEGEEVDVKSLSFNDQESHGTRRMFAIGGLILNAFESPHSTVIFLDEFNESIHPDLSKFIIELFQNPKVNRNNSQLVFATHETTLLDRKIFRKDQIWFSQKNNFGFTEFYSVKDFKDLALRSDIPFDKWYRIGKFGAIPNIRKYEFIAEYEEK